MRKVSSMVYVKQAVALSLKFKTLSLIFQVKNKAGRKRKAAGALEHSSKNKKFKKK